MGRGGSLHVSSQVYIRSTETSVSQQSTKSYSITSTAPAYCNTMKASMTLLVLTVAISYCLAAPSYGHGGHGHNVGHGGHGFGYGHGGFGHGSFGHGGYGHGGFGHGGHGHGGFGHGGHGGYGHGGTSFSVFNLGYGLGGHGGYGHGGYGH
ncbi:cold and drought-regulated protein CORA-like [Penaeus japonicus]|uniref:cold and drought-regulated protein CORA-like n=1 Tax=Penaeus japonicus TaxID=27405 RepID=UPI001C716539|nr:cold and drought-regulated protein CORA-like [Penaeus japonicus]